jgi:type IV pilus assembly protein PilB
VNTESAAIRRAFGKRLVVSGLCNEAQIRVADQQAQRTGDTLAQALTGLGFIGEKDLQKALAQEAGVPFVDLGEVFVDREVTKLVPRQLAQTHKLLPLATDGQRITICMADPLDRVAQAAIQRATNARVEVVTATQESILAAIELYYGKGAEADFDTLVREALASAKDTSSGRESPLVLLCDQLLIYGLQRSATDIHINPEARIIRTRYRIDGQLETGPSLPAQIQPALTVRIKIMAGLNISETRVPQDGKISYRFLGKAYDLRVSTLPNIVGENIVLRILRKDNLVLGLEKLGFSPETQQRLDAILEQPNGVLLVTGPTGSGKTTTLYSILSHLNSLERNIITVEDPVEYELPIIRQCQVNPKAGLTFATCLRSILRQDPDIILVGEMRDQETAELAVRAALTGHLVLSTLHTNDAIGAIPRLTDLGLQPMMLAESVRGIIAQRLVRSLCADCAVPYRPEARLLLRAKFPDDTIFYRGAGCSHCGNSGFRGRIAITELLPITARVAKMIAERNDPREILEAAVEEGMSVLFQDGLRKVAAQLTTLEEVMQVC